MKKRLVKQKTIRFKRWTNKPWAVFRSLHAVVHILKLKISVAVQSSLKQSNAGSDNDSVANLFSGLLHFFEREEPEIAENLLVLQISNRPAQSDKNIIKNILFRFFRRNTVDFTRYQAIAGIGFIFSNENQLIYFKYA